MENDLNKLRDRAYKCAIEHGFHDNEYSDAHWLMLVLTEIGEAVNADRKGDYANADEFISINDITIKRTGNKEYLNKYAFATNIKDSVEDELADVVIRLLDFAGLRNVNIDISNDVTYSKEYFNSISFVESSYKLCKMVMDNDVIEGLMVEETVNYSISYIVQWCKYLKIDIFQHIDWKMKYNELREYKNGKSY